LLLQLHSFDKLAQHSRQLGGGASGVRQLFSLFRVVEHCRKNIVGACNQLQRLPQIVTGHCQQRRGEVAVNRTRTPAGTIANRPGSLVAACGGGDE
jgi:hypothetical protein